MKYKFFFLYSFIVNNALQFPIFLNCQAQVQSTFSPGLNTIPDSYSWLIDHAIQDDIQSQALKDFKSLLFRA